MAEFVQPQFQNPDILGQYIRGQSAANQNAQAQQNLAAGQQGLDEGGLKLDQLRTVMGYQKQLAGQLAGTQSPDGVSRPSDPTQAPNSPASPYSAGPVNTMMALDALQGRDPLATAEKAQNYQKQQAQLQAQGPLNLFETLARSPDANKIVMNNPTLLAGWKKYAPMLGIDPSDPTQITTANANKVAGLAYNDTAGKVGLPPKDFGFTGTLNPGQTALINGQTVAGDPNGMSAFDRQKLNIDQAHVDIDRQGLKIREAAATSKTFTPEMGQLGAALAEQGVSLPAGFRSQAQQAQLYQGLLDRHPDQTPDQIASLVKAGKINMTGDMKEQSTAAGIAGKVKYAENELSQSAPLALAASANVPRGAFVPLNRLLQMGDSSISDPALRDLKVKTQSVLNAYDMLAARSGTDVGKREEAHRLLSTADSPEAYNAAVKAMLQEGTVAQRAGAMSLGKNPDAGSPPPGAPVDGATSTSKSGKPIVFSNGHWQYK